MASKKSEWLTVRLDRQLLKRIKILADADRRSPSSQVYVLLQDAVAAEEVRRSDRRTGGRG